MGNKKSIRYVKFIFLALLFFIFYGCEKKSGPTINTKTEDAFNVRMGRFDYEFRIVVIDSCEYLYTDLGNSGQTIFHKGNCRFCTKRNQKINQK